MIAENSGLNATEVIGQLKAAHARGEHQAGLDIETGQAKDLATVGIVDLFSAKVKSGSAIQISGRWLCLSKPKTCGPLEADREILLLF